MKINCDNELKNIIGVKLKNLRIDAGLTQKGLAEQLQLQGLDCSDLTILRIEKGTRLVLDREVKIIAEYFGISTDELLK